MDRTVIVCGFSSECASEGVGCHAVLEVTSNGPLDSHTRASNF